MALASSGNSTGVAGEGASPALDPSPFQRALPNWLTASRVAMSLVFFGVLTFWRFDGSAASKGLVDWLLIIAAALFIIAGLTDILDGYLARKWKVESAFGRIMDPFADKILVIGSAVFLAGPDFWWPTPETHKFVGHGLQLSGIYPWMVVAIVGRELLITSIRGALESGGMRFGADWSGKLKMFCQSVCVPTVLVTIALTSVIPQKSGGPWGRTLVDGVVWTTVIVTLISGVPYVLRALGMLAQWQRQRRQEGRD